MKVVRWNVFPEHQPEESRLYVVNWKVNNVYVTVLLFFDRNTKMWYDSNDRNRLIEGINAFNPFKIVPHI